MKTLFILSLFKQGYKVKVSTLYHLLKGKRTVSVLMSGFLFDNFFCFQLFPELREEAFYQILQQLIKDGCLDFYEESLEARLTDKGRQRLQKNSLHIDSYTNHLNGYKYGKTEMEMWRILQFLVQVTSHLSYQNNRYIPLEASPKYQLKIKKLLTEIDRKNVGSLMKNEWSLIFDRLSEEESSFLVQQFSGYQWNGKAEQQLLPDFSAFQKAVYRKNIYHHLFSCIEELEENAVLKKAVGESIEKNKNQSMLRTRELWSEGHSPAEIAGIRRMKPSTVNDHFLELAMSERGYAFDQFIPSEQIRCFQEISLPCQEWRYAELRQQFEVDYFSFRMYQIEQIKRERGK